MKNGNPNEITQNTLTLCQSSKKDPNNPAKTISNSKMNFMPSSGYIQCPESRANDLDVSHSAVQVSKKALDQTSEASGTGERGLAYM